MSLNNGGDTIALVSPAGTTVQSVTYAAVATNERCTVQTDGSVLCQ